MDSHLYLFVEYMDGGDLSLFLRRRGKLSEPLARIITKQIIAGLEYLHGLKIAHRNIQVSFEWMNLKINTLRSYFVLYYLLIFYYYEYNAIL